MEILVTRQDALRAGKTTYFTGKPCKHGHVAERQVSSFGCVVCARGVFKRWYDKNPEAHRLRTRNYVASNRAEVNRRKREDRALNREKLKEQRKRYYDADPVKARARSARHRAENPEKVKESQRKTKNKYRARATAIQRARDAAQLKALPAWADMVEIRKIYEKCRKMSKITGVPYEVDHIYPLKSKFVCGLHVEHNLRIVTAEVNRKKNNRIEEGL